MNHLNAFINLTIYAISFSDIQNGINIFITCLFPAVIVGLVLAGLNGMRKGIWRVTYDVLMLSVFYLTAFLTLNPLIKTVFSMDLSFAGFTNVVITNTQSGVSFYVPITNVLDTFTGVVEGFYALFDVQADPAAAAGFALAVAGSLLKLILVFVHLFLITLFGWLISFILWHAAFKKIVPNIARKLTKLRLLSLLENAVKYVVIAFLFMSPTTAIVNSINQAYQNSKANLDTNSESVKNIGGFLDSYNDSLFAKAFFNWTVDKDGITFDAKFIAALTEYSLNGSTVSLTGEFNNVISSVGILLNVFDFDFDQMKIANIDVESLLTENMVESVFDIIKKSGLITSALPIVTEIALNSNVLNEYFEARRIGSDTIDWEKEGDNIKDVLIEFVESDLKDLVFDFDEHGGIHMKELNVAQLIKDILNVDEEGNPSSTYYAVINAIESIDKSNLLSNVVPVAMKTLYESLPAESGIQNFLPTTWDELRDIQWGFEFKTLLDCVHRLFTLDKNGAGSLLDLFFQSPGGGGSGTEGSLYAPKPFKAEGDEGSSSPIPSEVIDFIIDNLAGFGEILFGTFDGEGNPTNVDKYGRTRITGTNQKYCLFDMRLMKNLLEPLIDLLSSSLSFDDEQLDELNSVVDDLTSGINWMGKYKKEFNSMFSVLTAFTENEEAKNTVKGLINGQPLVPEGENIFSLGQPIIDALSVGLRKLDNSNLAYAIFVPMLKNALMSSESYFIDMGLDIEYIKGGIDECYRDKCFGEELANILKRFKDIGNLAETISSGSDTTELLNRIAESSDSIIKILDTIANCKIFNPTPIEGRFEPNGNYFNLISNLFNQLNMDGFTFDRNDEEFKNMVWVNKYDNNDNILKKSDGSYYGENGNFVTVIKEIGESDILTHINNLNSSDPGVEKGAAMNGIADCIEDVLSAVDKSIVAKKTVSALFDSFLGDFIGVDEHISFSNVTDWEEEGHNLAEMLRSMQSILGDGGFESLDFSAIKDIVALNDMLHNLASSGIFVDKNNPDPDSNYQFGRWLYQKIESTLGSFSVGSDSIDLFKDPEVWDDSWGDKSSDIFYLDYAERYSSGNSYIAYRDFVSLTREEWCSEAYAKMDTSSYVTIDYAHYYDNPAFIDDFENGLKRGSGVYTLDEIDHLSSVIYHVGSLTSLGDITDLSADSLSGILNSINNCSPLRICVFNLYDMATKFIPEDIFSLKPAYNKYLIRGDALDMNPINSKNDRQSEIDKFADLFNKYKEMSSGSGIFGSGFTLESIDSETILNLKELLKDDLATSKVFHLSGSALYRDDGKYYPTVFENVIRMIFDKSFATILYNEDSPKDIAYKTTQYAKYNYAYTSDIDKNSKLDYIVDSCFSGKSLAEVSNNVDDIFECIYSVIGGTSDYSSITYDGLVDSSGNKTADFTQVDLTGDHATTNINSLNKLMKLLNTSELLYDCVPNALDKALSTFSFSGFGNVNLSDTSIYYHYNYNYNNDTYSLDYDRKYDEDEIDNFCDILLDAQALKGPGGSSISLSDKSGIQHLIDGDENSPLRNLLVDLHKSYSIHLQNEYLNSPTHETVFEQVIDTLCSSTTLSLFAYNGATSSTEEDQAAAALKLKNNIKAISNYENNNIVNPNGYYSKWMSDSAYGTQDNEIDAIMAFLGAAIDMMGDGDFSLTGDMSLDKLTPANVESILGNLNRVDIIKDAVPQFIKSGLGSVLGSYSTYDAVDYAYYNLSQVVYGGTNIKGDVNEGSEIYAICALLNNLYDDDNERYIQATDINSLHSSDKKLNGLMYFLFNTHIYNTNAGEYNVMHDKNGYPISGRGIFLYNIISQTGIDMSGYITGSNSDERIAVLSRIFTLSNADYRYESNGLCRLIGKISSLSLGSFSGSVDSVSAIKDTILEVMEASYDALGDGSNHRAYFTSELIAHLLDDSIESEYSNLATNHPLYYYEREYFAARSGLVRTYEDVTNNSYDNLNEIEKNGMDGAISLLEYVDSLVNLQAHSDEVRANFAKMGDSPDTNSFLAKVYYLSQAHESLYGITNESHLVMFGLNWQDIVDPYISGAGSIYADDFVFEEYGDSLADWLHI